MNSEVVWPVTEISGVFDKSFVELWDCSTFRYGIHADCR